MSRLNDHLNYTGYSQYGDAIVAQYAKYPKSLERFTPTYLGEWDDGELRAQTPTLIGHVQSGGYDFQALYNFGHWFDVQSCPVQSLICAWFGSHMVRTELSDSLVRMSLVDKTQNPTKCKAIAAVYNHGGQFSWSTLLNGGTLGEAGIASGSWSPSLVMSDPTIVLYPELLARLAQNETEDGLSQAQYDELKAMIGKNTADIAAIDTRVDTLEGTPPPPGTNYALASNGSQAFASSFFNDGKHGPDKVINGKREAKDWDFGNASSGWSASGPGHEEWLEVDFPAARSIDHVVAFSLQDDYQHAAEPSDSATCTKYHLQDFTVQAWLAGTWHQCGSAVVGNTLAKRTVAFPVVSTTKFRVLITKAAPVDLYPRCVELEAYGP